MRNADVNWECGMRNVEWEGGELSDWLVQFSEIE
jgi:hypothetical protein